MTDKVGGTGHSIIQLSTFLFVTTAHNNRPIAHTLLPSHKASRRTTPRQDAEQHGTRVVLLTTTNSPLRTWQSHFVEAASDKAEESMEHCTTA